uniref:Uncharacterized protein n=1 Tax=Chrysemys picta bellii TaxID=8478 RepID=A0A8C3FZ27_CHRPI
MGSSSLEAGPPYIQRLLCRGRALRRGKRAQAVGRRGAALLALHLRGLSSGCPTGLPPAQDGGRHRGAAAALGLHTMGREGGSAAPQLRVRPPRSPLPQRCPLRPGPGVPRKERWEPQSVRRLGAVLYLQRPACPAPPSSFRLLSFPLALLARCPLTSLYLCMQSDFLTLYK